MPRRTEAASRPLSPVAFAASPVAPPRRPRCRSKRRRPSPSLRRRGSPPAMELEGGGCIDELLRSVERCVGLIRLALEAHGDRRRRLVLVARRVDGNRGNLAGREVNLDADQCRVLDLIRPGPVGAFFRWRPTLGWLLSVCSTPRSLA